MYDDDYNYQIYSRQTKIYIFGFWKQTMFVSTFNMHYIAVLYPTQTECNQEVPVSLDLALMYEGQRLARTSPSLSLQIYF